MAERYRVRALNARIQSMRTHHQNRPHKDEAVELHTNAILTRFFGGVIY